MLWLTDKICSFLPHYLLSASSGDRRDAFQAGYTPAAKLNERESNHTFKRSFGRKITIATFSMYILYIYWKECQRVKLKVKMQLC